MIPFSKQSPTPPEVSTSYEPLALSVAEAEALAALDMPGLVDALRALVAIASVTGSAAEGVAQRWFASALEASGIAPDLWPIDLNEVKAHQEFPGLEAPREEAWGLVGTWGGSEGPTLVLNGHIDVVPPGDQGQWVGAAPYAGRLHDGAVYGRGACDMKGGLLCNLFAVKAIQKAGLRLRGKVLIESVVGEEDGGLGTFATLLRGYRGDAAIITEPTELAIVPACAGALTFRLRVVGTSAHGAFRREGVSAIEKFWPLWQALQGLEATRNGSVHPLMSHCELPYALSVGTLQAGDWPSSVPDKLVAEGRLGVALGESPVEARGAFEEALKKACDADPWLREQPAEVQWSGGQFASGQIPADHPLVHLVGAAHQHLHGRPPAVHGVPYGSDLRLMVGFAGVPTLHYGPGNIKNAHAPNEYVPIYQLEQAARTLVMTILRFCGYES